MVKYDTDVPTSANNHGKRKSYITTMNLCHEHEEGERSITPVQKAPEVNNAHTQEGGLTYEHP